MAHAGNPRSAGAGRRVRAAAEPGSWRPWRPSPPSSRPRPAPRSAGCSRRSRPRRSPNPAALVRLHETLCFLQAYPDDREILGRVDAPPPRASPRVPGPSGREARARLHDSGIAGSTLEYPYGLPLSRWLAARLGPSRRHRLGGSRGHGEDRGRPGPPGHAVGERRVQRGRLHGAPVARRGAGRAAASPTSRCWWRRSIARRSTRDCGTGCSRASGCRCGSACDCRGVSRTMAKRAGGAHRSSSGRRSGASGVDVVAGGRRGRSRRCAARRRRSRPGADRDRARRHGHPLAGAPRLLVPERRGRAGGGRGPRAARGADRAPAGVPAAVRGLLRVPGDPERRPGRLRRRLVPLRDAGVRLQRLRVLPAGGVGLDPRSGPPRLSPASSGCAPWWSIPISWARTTPRRSAPGAFYFYQHLGFRPREPTPSGEILEEELGKIARDRRYRSPLPVLRRLARDEACLTLPGGSPEPERRLRARDLAALVTRDVARRHGGDREAATRDAVRRVTRALGVGRLSGMDGRRAPGLPAVGARARPGAGPRPVAAGEPGAARPDDPRQGRPGRGTVRAAASRVWRRSAGRSRRSSARRRRVLPGAAPSAGRPARGAARPRRVARATPAMTIRAPTTWAHVTGSPRRSHDTASTSNGMRFTVSDATAAETTRIPQ